MANLKDRLPPLSSVIAFEAAARSGSYGAAAAQLNVTSAAISRQISRLEASLGTKVFQPLGRGRRLTVQGRTLFEAVTVSLEQLATAVTRIRHESASAPLTIATPLAFASLWMIPRIVSFRQKHPSVELRFITADADLDPVTGDIDLAVRYGNGDWPHLVVEPLLQPKVFPVCAPAFLDACGGISSIDELLGHTLLDRETVGTWGIGWSRWLDSLNAHPKKRMNKIFFNSYEVIVRAAVAGQGIALGVDLLVQDLLRQKLLVRPMKKQVLWREGYFLVSAIGKPARPSMKVFAEWLATEIAR